MTTNGHRPHTPDLLDALRAIEKEAKRAQEKLARREALTGVSALRRIEERAGDALAHAEARS